MRSPSLKNKYNRIDFRNKAKKGYISVIIPVYEDAKGLTDTLTSLSKQTLPQNKYEVIVANDGADIAVSDVCKRFRVREVKIPINKGSYNARNRALEVSRGEYLAFTDADVVVPDNWLENGVKYLQRYEYIGGPIIIYIKQNKSISNYYELFYNPFPVDMFFYKRHFFPTANVFIRRSVIHEIGGFDTRLNSSGDVEFGDRIKEFGSYKSKYINDIQVSHPSRIFSELKQKIARIAKGEKDLYNIYPERFKYLKRSIFFEIRNNLFPTLLSKKYIFNILRVRIYLLYIFLHYYRLYYNIINLRI